MQEGSRVALVHDFLVDVRGAERVFLALCDLFRYAWNARQETLEARGPFGRAALGAVFQRWRQWDWIAAQRVDAYVANSQTTRRRVARYFGREATVLHPPVEVARFAPGTPGDAYVVLSELMPHKRIDVAVRAFNELRLPLVIVGNGPDARRLHRLAGPTVSFTGRVSDGEAARLLARARALVVTATEEFGIAAVEAQAAGRPVIALHEGGVRETVIEGETGAFFDRAEPAQLAAAVRSFDALAIDPDACVANARRFDTAHFRRGLRAVVELALDGLGSRRAARRRPPRRARGLARPV
jgi:glycosyltransferase involved in cell wall biosynthesis